MEFHFIMKINMNKIPFAVLGVSLLCSLTTHAQSQFNGLAFQVGMGYEAASARVNNEVFNADGNGYMAQGAWGVNANVSNPSGIDVPFSILYMKGMGSEYSLGVGLDAIPKKRNFIDASTAPSAQNGGGDFVFPVSNSSVKNRYNIYLMPA